MGLQSAGGHFLEPLSILSICRVEVWTLISLVALAMWSCLSTSSSLPVKILRSSWPVPRCWRGCQYGAWSADPQDRCSSLCRRAIGHSGSWNWKIGCGSCVASCIGDHDWPTNGGLWSGDGSRACGSLQFGFTNVGSTMAANLHQCHSSSPVMHSPIPQSSRSQPRNPTVHDAAAGSRHSHSTMAPQGTPHSSHWMQQRAQGTLYPHGNSRNSPVLSSLLKGLHSPPRHASDAAAGSRTPIPPMALKEHHSLSLVPQPAQ